MVNPRYHKPTMINKPVGGHPSFDRDFHNSCIQRIHESIQKTLVREAPLEEDTSKKPKSLDYIRYHNETLSRSVINNPLANEDDKKIRQRLSHALLRISGLNIDE